MGLDDHPEFWFNLYGITALVGLAVSVERISKLAHICDKRAAMCNHWMAFLPSVVPFTLGALAYLGLMIPSTFIHVNEGDASQDSFYDVVNWISYVVMALLFMWPHLYALDYYSSKKWKKYVYRSHRYIAALANILYWVVLLVCFLLMGLNVGFTAYDHRWRTFGIYLGFSLILAVATIYFMLEWYYCKGEYQRLHAYYSDRPMVVIIELMERQALESTRGRIMPYKGL